eukprot:5897259-Amphidinium_carterae.1
MQLINDSRIGYKSLGFGWCVEAFGVSQCLRCVSISDGFSEERAWAGELLTILKDAGAGSSEERLEVIVSCARAMANVARKVTSRSSKLMKYSPNNNIPLYSYFFPNQVPQELQLRVKYVKTLVKM